MIEWDDPIMFQKALFFFTCVMILSLILPMTIRADMVTINVPVAAIREEPSDDSPEAGVVKQGESLNIVTKEGAWYKVRLPNHFEGWISGSLIKAEREEPTIPSSAEEPEASQTPKEETIASSPEGPKASQAPKEKTIASTAEEPEASQAPKGEKQDLVLHLKVIRPAVNIRSGPGISHMWVESVHANDILSAFEEKNGWYRCKTPKGKEGWIIGSACQMIPIHSESARLEIRRIIINAEEIPVKAGPDAAYPDLGRLYIDQEVGVYLEEGKWLYIKKYDENLEGWIKGDHVYDPAKEIDTKTLKEEVLNISEKLSFFYDQKKKDIRSFQDAGWYPSFSVFLRDKDIVIKPLMGGVRLELTLSLQKISLDTLLPLPRETLPLSLTKSDRLFFMSLFQTIMENEMYQEVDIRLRGLKKEGSALKWVKAGNFTLRRSSLEGIDLDQIDPDDFWNLLARKKD